MSVVNINRMVKVKLDRANKNLKAEISKKTKEKQEKESKHRILISIVSDLKAKSEANIKTMVKMSKDFRNYLDLLFEIAEDHNLDEFNKPGTDYISIKEWIGKVIHIFDAPGRYYDGSTNDNSHVFMWLEPNLTLKLYYYVDTSLGQPSDCNFERSLDEAHNKTLEELVFIPDQLSKPKTVTNFLIKKHGLVK